MPAKFHDHNAQSGLKDKRKLSAYIDTIVKMHLTANGKTTLNYIFCNDEYLLHINKQFLDHDTYTDIITFDMTEPDERLSGEIYISVDRVRDNAAKYETTYQQELHRVIFHGVLHLCGFKDKTPTDKKSMRQAEDNCLAQYFKKE